MWVSFCQDDPGFAIFRAFASAPSSSSGRSNSQTAPPASFGPASVIKRVPSRSVAKCQKSGPSKERGQVIAPAARRVDAFIADVGGRPTRDKLSFVRFARRGAGDGHVASSLPALMPLTEFVPHPGPKGSRARSVPSSRIQVDVRAQSAGELFHPAIGVNDIPVVFLDHDVMGSLGVHLTRVLRVQGCTRSDREGSVARMALRSQRRSDPKAPLRCCPRRGIPRWRCACHRMKSSKADTVGSA